MYTDYASLVTWYHHEVLLSLFGKAVLLLAIKVKKLRIALKSILLAIPSNFK